MNSNISSYVCGNPSCLWHLPWLWTATQSHFIHAKWVSDIKSPVSIKKSRNFFCSNHDCLPLTILSTEREDIRFLDVMDVGSELHHRRLATWTAFFYTHSLYETGSCDSGSAVLLAAQDSTLQMPHCVLLCTKVWTTAELIRTTIMKRLLTYRPAL